MAGRCPGPGREARGLTLLCSGPGIVRASSVFPILSTILLLLGGLCIGAGRIYSRKNNIVLSAGILFVAAGKLLPHCQHKTGHAAESVATRSTLLLKLTATKSPAEVHVLEVGRWRGSNC